MSLSTLELGPGMSPAPKPGVGPVGNVTNARGYRPFALASELLALFFRMDFPENWRGEAPCGITGPRRLSSRMG